MRPSARDPTLHKALVENKGQTPIRPSGRPSGRSLFPRFSGLQLRSISALFSRFNCSVGRGSQTLPSTKYHLPSTAFVKDLYSFPPPGQQASRTHSDQRVLYTCFVRFCQRKRPLQCNFLCRTLVLKIKLSHHCQFSVMSCGKDGRCLPLNRREQWNASATTLRSVISYNYLHTAGSGLCPIKQFANRAGSDQ